MTRLQRIRLENDLELMASAVQELRSTLGTAMLFAPPWVVDGLVALNTDVRAMDRAVRVLMEGVQAWQSN